MSIRPTLTATLFLLTCILAPQISLAQEMSSAEYAAPATSSAELLNQVDITHGIAEQSAMNASRFSPNGYSAPEFQNYNAPQSPAQAFTQPQVLQGYANQNAYAQQNPQNWPQNFMDGQPQQQYQQQCGSQAECTAPSQGSSNFGTGINQQMVGVLGAAVLFNYMTNGGIQNLVGEMGSRGWNNRFRTMGAGGVVYH